LLQRLEGEVLEVSYRDQVTGYTVASVVVSDGQVVTVVGAFPLPMAGERLVMEGRWTVHRRYGRQFCAEDVRMAMPSSLEGLVRYLSSGVIPKVGPSTARRIVEHFKEETLDVLDNRVERLLEIPGIGPKRVEEVRLHWEEHRRRRQAVLQLLDFGIGSALADRIVRIYGDLAAEVVRSNPYQLAYDVAGIGFVTADRIAQRVGICRDAPERLDAGILFSMRRAVEEGHSMLPWDELLQRSRRLLAVDSGVEERLELLCTLGMLEAEELGGLRCVYLPGLRRAEAASAGAVRDMAASSGARLGWELEGMITALEGQFGIRLEEPQRRAVKGALSHRIFVITGGPGTGKTTLLRFTVRLCQMMGLRVLLAAPTGRAAKRMAEVTGVEAYTLHRALEYDPRSNRFGRGSSRPLEADVVIVDEFSMVDLPMFHRLLSGIGEDASLVLVGDSNQLPSIGPGSVLKDLISSGSVPKVELKGIFRQAQRSLIIRNSYRILEGGTLELPPLSQGLDVAFVEEDDPSLAAEAVVDLVGYEIPRCTGLSPWDVQVLTPMHKGEAGARNLCLRLQEVLNPSGERLRRGEGGFRRGDKVIQLKNDYDLEIYNGDIGVVEGQVDQGLLVDFEGRRVQIRREAEVNLALAYALTIHKSQGSEYPAVVVPLLDQHFVMLKRNLLYTALTRAKRLAVLVGSRRAIERAVSTQEGNARYGALRWRLAKREEA
jgi:exodeoxyribonuclease V alpha subunit